jgi:hypothetical protein
MAVVPRQGRNEGSAVVSDGQPALSLEKLRVGQLARDGHYNKSSRILPLGTWFDFVAVRAAHQAEDGRAWTLKGLTEGLRCLAPEPPRGSETAGPTSPRFFARRITSAGARSLPGPLPVDFATRQPERPRTNKHQLAFLRLVVQDL